MNEMMNVYKSLNSPVYPFEYIETGISSYLGFLIIPWAAIGHPDSDRCVKKVPLMCPVPSQFGVGQLTPSNFMAVATATAALCCSTVPPLSSTLILFRFAIGQPEALKYDKKNILIFIFELIVLFQNIM